MNSAALAEENHHWNAALALAERDGRIDTLEFGLSKLKQVIFGARPERLTTLPDPAQLPFGDEQPKDRPVVSRVEFKSVMKSPAKGQAKRTALPVHLPRESMVLPLSAGEWPLPAAARKGQPHSRPVQGLVGGTPA